MDLQDVGLLPCLLGSRSQGRERVLYGLLASPIVSIKARGKMRIHLILIIKYLQGAEAEETVSKRNSWRLKTNRLSHASRRLLLT